MNLVPPDSLARRWLLACGGALGAIAGLGLAGHLLDQARLITIVEGGAAMAVPTAAGILIAAIGFVAAALARGGIVRVAAITIALLGAGTLASYVSASPVGMLRFFYPPAGAATPAELQSRGWTSPNGAASLVLLGGGLLLLGARRPRRALAGACIALLLAIAALGVLSYATGLRSAVAWWRFSAMSVHTAIAFLIAGAGLLAWFARRIAAEDKAPARTVPFFVVSGAAVLVLAATILVSNEQRHEAARLENHALQVEAGIDRFIASVARLESATRAFALTGDEPYLTRIRVHRDSITGAAEMLIQLTEDSPGQHERALALRRLSEEKFAINEAQVRARREAGAEAAARVLRAENPEVMAGLRAVTEGLAEEERRVLLRRRVETERNERRLHWVLLAGGLVTIALISTAFGLVQRAQRGLQEANEKLEERVRQRTAELEATTSQVRENERRLRFLADTMPQLVWTARPDGTIESVNRGWLEYLGLAREAEAIAALADVVHPDDLPATLAEWAEMFREQRTGHGELRLRRADGTYRWHLWRAHPERDAGDRVVRWVGTSTDFHDQKLAEERLEQRVAARTADLATSEERFRQAFDFAGIGMAIAGLDGRWLRANHSLCDTVGYSESELLAKTFQDITHPDDLGPDLHLVRELLEGKRRVYQIEKRYLHKDGHPVWIRLTASLVRTPAGEPVHFVSQIEDITERKQLEASLAAARDQALEASRLKSEFLAVMSHEIRTPMNGVIGMTALLRDTPLTETQAEYLRTIESSGESLLTLINDILDYSKIEAGRIELEVTTFDLQQCVEDALDLFAVRAAEKGIDLVFQIEPGVPEEVAGDATRLRQVLVNLLGNAVKFTARGEILITVARSLTPGGDGLHFTIRDTGIGIAPEGMARLFKSFSQVDASTTRRFGGTGLGLAISKRLADVMGGEMWAESTPGVGSTFHFTVKVTMEAAARARDWNQSQLELQGRRVLIIDDNATARGVVGRLAQLWGFAVTEAESAGAALAAWRAGGGYDLAIVDAVMPGLNGEQTAAAIRAQPGGREMPLLLVTPPNRKITGGVFAQTVFKPVKPDALLAAVRACLRPRVANLPAASATPSTVHDVTLGRRCPLRLLVAEDNVVNQKVTSLLLQRLGYRSTIVANGLEAIEALEMADYEAVLMDIDMPELDGCEATRRIRARWRSPRRPWIIAVTAGAMQEDRERALAAGMNDFLTKPVRGDALSEALERAHGALADGG